MQMRTFWLYSTVSSWSDTFRGISCTYSVLKNVEGWTIQNFFIKCARSESVTVCAAEYKYSLEGNLDFNDYG